MPPKITISFGFYLLWHNWLTKNSNYPGVISHISYAGVNPPSTNVGQACVGVDDSKRSDKRKKNLSRPPGCPIHKQYQARLSVLFDRTTSFDPQKMQELKERAKYSQYNSLKGHGKPPSSED
ncbi:hypothetical protein MJO29_002194 [Puccinia striiformis f. sp. tritici]|nr:hypothetical protein MJO29_002194 [Puccinia striiformis f. sp. tritici]